MADNDNERPSERAMRLSAADYRRGLPWDDLKVCFGCGDNVERLWAAHADGRLTLPKGWELNETDISGAAGYVAIFRVDGVLPIPSDAYKVKAELRRWTR